MIFVSGVTLRRRFDEEDTVSRSNLRDMDCDCDYAKSIGAACDKGSRELPNPLYSTVVGTLNNGQAIAGYPMLSRVPTIHQYSWLASWVSLGKTLVRRPTGHALHTFPSRIRLGRSAGAGTQPDNQPASGANGIWKMIFTATTMRILRRKTYTWSSR